MATPSRAARAVWSVTVVFGLSFATAAAAQARSTPCGLADNGQLASSHGLTAVNGSTLVYDANQSVCWLADANLAGNPFVRAQVTLASKNPDGSTPLINPDGTMDYQTALNWVNALNSFNGGKGWLNHNNWQLPTNISVDPTCRSQNKGNFGVLCTGSALGNLYNVGLARTYPNSVVPVFLTLVWPLFNLQPGLYWADSTDSGGEKTYSFNTGDKGSNTTKYNFLHVLPVTKTLLGPIPPGAGVVPYLSGPAAGRAVYDKLSGLSWTLNANLPALENFGVTDTETITSDVDGTSLTVRVINKDGAVLFSTVDPNATSGWLSSMNGASYAGTNTWALPTIDEMRSLHDDLGMPAGDPRLEWPF